MKRDFLVILELSKIILEIINLVKIYFIVINLIIQKMIGNINNFH